MPEPTIDELKKQIDAEKKKVSVLEQRLRTYELPGEMRGFYSMQRILNQQSDFLNTFEFANEIKRFAKDDKLYDRASDLWEKLSGNLSKVKALRIELGITGDEEKDTARKNSFLDKNI